jgi:hypothetical protein
VTGPIFRDPWEWFFVLMLFVTAVYLGVLLGAVAGVGRKPEPVAESWPEEKARLEAQTREKWYTAENTGECLLCNQPMREHPSERMLRADPRYCPQVALPSAPRFTAWPSEPYNRPADFVPGPYHFDT